MKNFAEIKKACDDFGFNRETSMEQCWNAGYQLGRRRWYWGPSWFVSFQGWINTQLSKWRAR